MNPQDERLGLPSASGGSKWYGCAGSVALERIAPEDEPSDEAIQGTEIAEARERESSEGLDDDGKTIFERLKYREQEAFAAWLAERFPDERSPVVQRRAEERFWVHDPQTMAPVASAKPDWFYIFKDEALCGDDKSGFLTVTPAHKNIQARIQAVALKHEFPNLKRIRVAISQFRFTEKFSASDYDEKALAMAEQEIFFRLWLTEDPYAPRVPGAHCRWCRAKAFCPESACRTMLPMVMTDNRVTSKDNALEAVSALSLAQLAHIRLNKPLIEAILSAVGTRLKSFPETELNAMGLCLVETQGRREFKSANDAWNVLYRHGVTADEYRAICTPPVGKAEELLTGKLAEKYATKKAAKAEAAKLLEEAVTRKEMDPQLRQL